MRRSPVQTLGSRHVTPAVSVIVLVLAFTAIPAELRPPRLTWSGLFDPRLEVYDIAVNILGYLPLGAVLASHTLGAAAAISALTSAFAEATQVIARGREPSLVDFATNLLGALIGWALTRRWRFLPPRFRITPRRAAVAAMLALTCFLVAIQWTPRDVEESVTAAANTLTVLGLSSNDRGATTPGALEARWTFDDQASEQDHEVDAVSDASGNGVSGVLVNEPDVVPGINGDALQLNARNQFVDFGRPVSLRLTGSMTVSAWINSSRFPRSDAVVVSNYGGLGYQLDTTVDQGPRTIAFRFTNSWGGLTSRYGATPLETNRWYHIAGVFDANARTLNVFLDGVLDNGCLAGTVTSRQTISPDHVYVGRPARPQGFTFAGLIDDVRIYSRALSQGEIQEEMQATSRQQNAPRRHRPASGSDIPCLLTEPPDSRTAGLIVTLGILVAVAVSGLWPFGNYRWVALTLSLVAGILVAPAIIAKVPAYEWWLMPLLTLAGAAAVVVSTRSDVGRSAPDDESRL